MSDFEFEEKLIETSGGEKYICLAVNGALGINNVARLKELLLDAFARLSHVVLDMEKVSSVDFTLCQLLCATNKYAQLHHKTFTMKNLGCGCFIDRVQSLGYLREQGCNEAENPEKCLWIAKNLS